MLSFCHDIGLKSCWDFFLPFFCFVTPTCKALVSHWTILLFVHRLEIHYGPPDLPLQACVTWWHCRRQVLSCHSFREERVLRVPGTHHWRFPTVILCHSPSLFTKSNTTSYLDCFQPLFLRKLSLWMIIPSSSRFGIPQAKVLLFFESRFLLLLLIPCAAGCLIVFQVNQCVLTMSIAHNISHLHNFI